MAKTTSQIIAENKKKREEAAAIAASRNVIHNEQIAPVAAHSVAKTKAVMQKAGMEDIAPILKSYYTPTVIDAPVSDRIASRMTVGKKNEEEKKQKRKWFEKGLFEDGYDVGDITKTILGTATDTLENVGAGIIGMGEKAVDAMAYIAPYAENAQFYQNGAIYTLEQQDQHDKVVEQSKKDLGKFVAKDLYDEEKIARAIISDPARKIGIDSETQSVFGEKSDALIQSGGQLLATAGLAAAGMPWWLTTGATSFGSEAENAMNQGATYEAAGASAAISAGAEILSEKLSGGISFGGKSLDDALTKQLARGISNKLGRTAAKLGLDMVGEGSEEVFSQLASNLGSSLYKEEDITELLFNEEAMDGYLESFIGGAALGGVSNAYNAVKSGKKSVDYATGLTQNEQKIVDKLYKDELANLEKEGKVTQKDKNKIYDTILEDMENGDISIDTIEEVLGGDIYKSYRETVDREDAILKEYEELGEKPNATPKDYARYTELTEQVKDIYKNSQRGALRSQLNETMQGILQHDRLQASYRENNNSKKAFEADVTKYGEKQRAIVQKAMDAKTADGKPLLSNSKHTHTFVDFVAKISEDTGVDFDFTDTKRLQEAGFAMEGQTIDGFYDPKTNTVTLNSSSPKARQFVVGHEITHALEGTDLYDALRKSVFDYAKMKNQYGVRMESIQKRYKEGTDFEAELTADLVGEYIFSDTDFINNLSTQNRNVFQKVYDEIKYLCKVATAGSKEARELEKVKRAFEKAYQEGGTQKNTAESGVKYSLTQYSEQQKQNWATSKRIVIYDNPQQLSQFIRDSATDKTMDKKMYFGAIPSDLATRIQDDTGVSVENYNLSLGSYEIRKILKDHGNEYTESPRGQRAVVEDDFAHIVDVVLNPQNIVLSEDTYMGKPAIVFTGENNGRMNVVAVVSNKRLDLFVQTVFVNVKKGNLSTPTGEQAPINTPEANSGTVSNVKVSQKGENVKYSLSDSDGRQLSSATAKRFANSKIVDNDGNLKAVYHGTASGEFTIFDKAKGSVEGDFGSGFYFTDNEADVSEHYEGGGPDFDNKVARLAEQIEADEDIDYEEAEERARAELYKGSHKFEVYLNIENPAIVGKTYLFDSDFGDRYNEEDFDDYDEYLAETEQAIAEAVDELIWEVEKNVDVYSTDGLADIIYEAYYDGGIGIEELKKKINNLYLEDSNGNLVGNEVARQIIESLGYDGIIDPTVSGKWNMDIEDGTTHYIVFKPNQIKAVTNQNPTDNPDIHRSLSNVGEQHTPDSLSALRFDAPVAENATTTPTVSEMESVAPVAGQTLPNSRDIAPIPVKQEKQGFWNKLIDKTVDKGMVFENAALKSGNMELQAKWDYALPAKAAARAQYFMRNGKNGSPSLDSVRKQVEKSNKTKDFQDYMWHWRNVDSMTLNERFGVDNKPVFGTSITADISRKKIEQYEKENPEFKDFAKDLYSYFTEERRMMVDSGLITEEQAAHLQEMYPHYIPIHREMDEMLVPVQNKGLGVNSPIKSATGGNRPLQPMFDTIAQHTIQAFKAAARNDFGVELKNTIQTYTKADATNADEIFDSIDNQDNLLGVDTDGYTFSVYENGQKVTFGITEAMHDALKPTDGLLAKRIKPLTAISNLRRNLITTWSPVFALYRNPSKDLQDVMINSQHPVTTYKNVPTAIKELLTGGEWAFEYLENGGEQNTYYDNRKSEFTKEESVFEKLIGMPVRGLEAAGEFIERIPRLAEYIASRKEGRSVQRSMLDSARVTTNFAAGGDFTKFLNSHGFTFLNAGVQGTSQFVRNFREAKMNGLKGWLQLAAKFTAAGLVDDLLNGLFWDEENDEDYEALSDNVKQNYYVIAKMQNGKFVRIPKGRAAAVIQDAFEQMEHLVTGDDEADFESFFKLFMDNVAPGNPLDNNIIAPIGQALSNKTWYGDNLVPARLEDLPAAEQFDESTDSISKWLGEQMDISPYKINYLIDQYSGGLGDFILPTLTPEAENNDDSLQGYAIGPWKKEFTTDSVLNNRVTGVFYEVLDAAEAQAKSENASVEDKLKSQFLITNNVEISKLMQKQREIQSMDLSDADKYEYSRDIKKAINAKMEEALAASENMKITGKYAEVGGHRYNYDEGKRRWCEIKSSTSDGTVNWYYQKEQNITKTFGVSYEDYWNNKVAYDDLWYLANGYDNSRVDSDSYVETYKVLGADEMVKYASGLAAIKADKDEYGNSIPGTRKKKVKEYIYGLNIPDIKKDILYKTQYSYDVRNNNDIVEYLRKRLDVSADDMRKIIEELGGKMDKNGNVTW